MNSMLKLLATLAVLSITQNAFALLPPFYQSTKEMIAILSSPEVAKKLASPYPIKSITRIDSGYRIAIDDCTLDVNVTYTAQEKGMVGPANFEITPKEKVCHKQLQDTD